MSHSRRNKSAAPGGPAAAGDRHLQRRQSADQSQSRRGGGRGEGRPSVRGAVRTAELPVSVPQPYTDGRQLAFAVLQECDRSERFAQDVFADFETRHQLSSRDRALAVDVASGVVRRSRTLDVLIESRLTRPRQSVEPDLWRVLRLGAYQLLFARTPAHAAVDSSVDLCRRLGRERWTGFVNGVLRNLGRLLTDSECHAPAPIALPMTSGAWRTLNAPVFADPLTDRAQYFADAFSLPQFLAARWCERMSEQDLIAACFYSVSPPSTTLRVNLLRARTDDVLAALTASDCQARRGNLEESISLEHSARLDSLPGYTEGLWCVQDEAAMAASLLLAPQPGEEILDLCAAPGGKTTHLAELSGGRVRITACDVSEGRLRRVLDNAARLQLTCITPQLISKDGRNIPSGPFDAALVDVPCSNTGVLNRRPEARWRCDEKSLQELVVLQSRLLAQACERIRPGGRVVYSTCSLEPEENRGVVDAVLAALVNVRLEREILHLPGQPADGAYQALLIRK